jgi:hypothetical protein
LIRLAMRLLRKMLLRSRQPLVDAFEQSRRERKRIEMRFAHLKRILRLGRL